MSNPYCQKSTMDKVSICLEAFGDFIAKHIVAILLTATLLLVWNSLMSAQREIAYLKLSNDNLYKMHMEAVAGSEAQAKRLELIRAHARIRQLINND